VCGLGGGGSGRLGVGRWSLVVSRIISISTGLPDTLSDFIPLTKSETYAENRRNRGLTRFARIEKQVSMPCLVGSPGLGDANVIDANGWF